MNTPARRPPDDRDLAALRAALGEAGYAEPGLGAALGADLRPLGRHLDRAAALRRLPGGRLSTLIRLFLLGLPLPVSEVRGALAPLAPERLARSGLLASAGGRIQARVRIVPYDGLLLACDRALPPSDDPPADYVDGVLASTPVLAALTVRRPVGSALDLGTGSGVQALLAARHSRRVVAVDVNPRALAFTTINAALNGTPRLECRRGSLFAPVQGRRFDLVVSNPPYVISPDSALGYRDSGWPGDTFCRALVRRAPRFLREGGWAIVLCHWVCRTDAPWWDPLRQWTAGAGVDAWLLHHATHEPAAYAAGWNASLRRDDPARYAAALDRWRRAYRGLGIEAIAEGAILLRRRTRGRNWIRADHLPAPDRRPAGSQILRTAALQDFLVRHPDDARLGHVRFQVASHQRRALQPPGHASGRFALRLDQALPLEVEVEAQVLALLDRLDGRRSLREAIAGLARDTGGDRKQITAAVLPSVRRLVRQGLLLPG